MKPKLVPNAGRVLRRAWSIRLLVAAVASARVGARCLKRLTPSAFLLLE